MLGLKDTILGSMLNVQQGGNAASNTNDECYTELIQLSDDKSLSLVMRDAADDGRKALHKLKKNISMQVSQKSCITLYLELTSLKKSSNELYQIT
ncbi:hypothetical protein HOLleu_19384 [Holothuria leucospilota]|uniref:Uncharacterized protein n=1 Tax=Holothuria leucospilota TaxID=206669 RepID=A0A9Q1BYA8_HOLLE|nr:hypothetical protein HOLleu_19384 [Holothuria leucospilota]